MNNKRSTFEAPRVRLKAPSINVRYAAYSILASSIVASAYALTVAAAEVVKIS